MQATCALYTRFNVKQNINFNLYTLIRNILLIFFQFYYLILSPVNYPQIFFELSKMHLHCDDVKSICETFDVS